MNAVFVPLMPLAVKKSCVVLTVLFALKVRPSSFQMSLSEKGGSIASVEIIVCCFPHTRS